MSPRTKKHVLSCGFAFFLFSEICPATFGQTTLFQDAKGESSIILADQSLLFINSGDASIGFSYALFQSNTGKYWGFNVKFKAEEGISYVLKNGGLSLNGSLGVLYGWRDDSRKRRGITDDFYVSGNISSSKIKLFDERRILDEQIIEEGTLGISIKAGWNRIASTAFLGKKREKTTPTIFGVSLGVGLTNNLDSLDKISIIDYSPVNDEESGGARLIQRKSTSAFSPYPRYVGRLGFARLNADYALIPGLFSNRVVLLVFSRMRFSKRKKQC